MTKISREGAVSADRESSRPASAAVSHAQHSQLPWTVEIDDNGQANLYAADDQWIALMPHQCLGSLEALMHRNAAFIVRAVNHHEALLTALKGLVREFEHASVVHIPLSFDIKAIADARAVMLKAEGQ